MKVFHIVLVCVMTVLVCILPATMYAQRSRIEEPEEASAEDAYNAARQDAKDDISKFKWLGCGCLGSWIGVGVAFLVSSSPDQAQLMGKSTEYVYTYTRTYKKTARSIRTKYAMIGCGVTGLIATTGCIVAASQETCDPSCGLDDACADPLGLNSCLENFESSGCYESGVGCKSPESCDDEVDCVQGESCSDSPSCGTSSSPSCGGSAEYLSP